jgi:hypothetical protein
MLIEYRSFYQFDFFLLNSVVGTPEWVHKFTPVFEKLGMMPSLVSHPNSYLGLSEQRENLQQLTFVTAKRDVVVIFDEERYIIKMRFIPNKELSPIKDFIKNVTIIFDIINGIVESKASRLALVTTGICKQMQPDKLTKIHQTLFNFPKEFRENEVIECNDRQVYRTTKNINGKSELLNVILNLNRIQVTHHFEHKPIHYDGIEIVFEVNTFQGNYSQRFAVDDVKPFLDESFHIENNLEESLQKIIDPESIDGFQ